MNIRDKKNGHQRKLGMERIERLFELAEKDSERHPERSCRNVQLARKIAMRYNIRMPARLKRRFCSKCFNYLPQSINCGPKKRGTLPTSKCPRCGHAARHPGD